MSMAVSNENEQRYSVIFSSLIELKALTSYFLQPVAVWSNATCFNVIVGEGLAYTHLNNPWENPILSGESDYF